MTKKIIMMTLLIVAGCLSFAAKSVEINDIAVNENKMVFTFAKSIPKYQLNYDENSGLIFIEFVNSLYHGDITKLSGGEFVEKIDTVAYENNSDFFITMGKDVKYIDKEVINEENTLILNFQKKTNKKRPVIVVDAGHGGKDPGAVGYEKLKEKDIALKIALMVKERLDGEFDVRLTRDGDFFIPLPDRPKAANDINADFFMSIHLNAMPPNQDANGIEVFYYSRNESAYAQKIANYENSVDEKFGIKTKVTDIIIGDLFYKVNQEESMSAAKLCIENLVNMSGFNIRPNGGIYGANFAVLRGSSMPAVLVELGFLTNKGDAERISTEAYQKKMVEGIYNAMKLYFKNKG